MKRIFAAAALAAIALPAGAHERIVPEEWKETYETFHYAPAVRAGDMVYLSGVVATLREDEDEANAEDVEAAIDRAFQAIGAILAEAGSDFSDVVEMTTYHTELLPQAAAFTAVKDRYLMEPYPAWTAIDVDRLYPDRGLVEIKVTAHIRQSHDGDHEN